MPGFQELRGGGPEEIVSVLSREGFEERRGHTATSRRDRQPAGCLWQGVDARTGSVASATWVNRPGERYSLVFIEVDGEPLAAAPGRASRA